MTTRLSRILLVPVVAIVILACGAVSRLRANEAKKLDAFIRQGMQDWSLTGLAVAVVKDDKVVFIRGYGVSDIRTKAAIDEHTVFQIGSCSKPLSAAGIALLVQDGRIKWDTPIIERWRDFQAADPVVTKQATIRDILCHRTGVGKDESVLYYGMPITGSELLRRLPEVQQAAPFRTEWRYSGLMYVVAGRVVEQITGESWDQYMSKRVFQPLGMTRTRTSMKSLAQMKNVAVPHVRVNDETYPTEFADQDSIGPGASISSCVSDLSQWLLMMVNEGRYQGKQMLKPEVVREMVKPQIMMPFVDPVHGDHVFDAYGLGLMLRDYHGWRIANHSGMAGHSLGMVGFVPEKSVGVVVLTNHRRCLFHYAVFRRALDLYCGMPPIDLDTANKKLLAELLVRESASLKRRTAARDPSKKHTLPFKEYRGTYKGKYDLLTNLEMESGGMVLRYGNFVADVTHWHDDTFRARLRQRRLADEQDWYLTFTVVKGAIVKLHIDSEHDVHADFVPVATSDHRRKDDKAKPLARRPFLGVQIEAKDDQVKIAGIFPCSSASRSELKVGDAVHAIDETKVTTVSDFLSTMKRYSTGDRVKYRIIREKKDSVIEVALTEWPGETASDLDIIYDSVEAKDARLRCLLTKPKSAKPGAKLPAVLYIQGIDCASIEAPFAFPNPMRELIYDLTRAGFVVMRCEKSGVGDSTGKPCEELGLHEEVADFVSAVKKLKSYDFVDSQKVFLFGHSAGGWVAPLVASKEPVQGIIVYGTVVRPFAEYLVENRRRNQRLRTSRAPVDIEDEVRHLARFLHYVLVEKREVEEVLKDHGELAGAAKVVFPEKQSLAYGVRHLGYFREIHGQNMARVWAELGLPVLAMVGEFEIRTTAVDHEYVAEIVNSIHPGKGTWKQLPGMDHGLTLHTSLKNSVRDEFKGPFGRRVVLESVEWMRKVLDGKAIKGPEKPSNKSGLVSGGDRFAGMDVYIRAALEKWQVPGLAIAVVKDGEIVLARGYGVCELGKDQKVSANTAFTLASSAKSFIAAALGMLVEEGKLRWDDPVAKHLPGFELADRHLTEHVTLRDLLCHRTGLRGADLLGDGAGFDAKEILRRLKHLEPMAELRTQYIYNNHMYTVLGEVVTRVSGQPWEKFVAERIFRPLDMNSTTATAIKIPPDRLALRHWRSDAGIVARPVKRDMYSTVGDMAHWLKLQLAEGTYGDRRLLKSETVREMHALQFSIPVKSRPKNNIYAAQFHGTGLGWGVQDYRGRKVVSHGGAWGAMVAMMPEEKLGVVVLSNLDLEYLAALLMYDVFDAYLVGPGTAWDRDKWETTWLRNEPVGSAYRPRDEAKARLEKTRTSGTKPSLPLEKYVGTFDSKLYGRLAVRHDEGRLFVTFGEFTTELSHWQDESFYVRSPTRITFDWLLTFEKSKGGQVTNVTVKHVGWEKDEKDHVFVRGI